jgi:hypothetical protein
MKGSVRIVGCQFAKSFGSAFRAAEKREHMQAGHLPHADSGESAITRSTSASGPPG